MEEREISCPFCGEAITLLIDCSVPEQQYTEDCQVCCSPILISVEINHDGHITLINAVQENG